MEGLDIQDEENRRQKVEEMRNGSEGEKGVEEEEDDYSDESLNVNQVNNSASLSFRSLSLKSNTGSEKNQNENGIELILFEVDVTRKPSLFEDEFTLVEDLKVCFFLIILYITVINLIYYMIH